jgi:hypothetical protein
MPHVAESIVLAVKTELTGLTTSGANVFDSRVYDLQDAELPALLIEQGDEEVEQTNVQGDLERTLTITVAATVKQAAGYRSTLNKMRAEVEAALDAGMAPGQPLAGLCQDLVLAGTTMEASGEGEKPAAKAVMTFVATYTTARGYPETPL